MRSPAYVIRHAPGPAVGVTAFAVLSVVMTMLVAGTLMKSAGTDPEEYHAVFRDTNGLTEGDDVRMAGVRVGTGGEARAPGRARPRHLHGLRRPAGAHRQPRRDQLPQPDRPALPRHHPRVRPTAGSPGATIPESRTSPGLDLTALFNAFKPLFDLLRPADVNKLATQITAVLQGQGPTINDLIAQTAEADQPPRRARRGDRPRDHQHVDGDGDDRRPPRGPDGC